ncbi:hypothetical protein VQ044_03665 [Aurantimonas sp. C2-5-R2]|uniref:hypothetical protein n=1 Tax=Aurantimonas sp. C2-5-R2 TaxID=3113713 RepID=UPI002F95225A
MAALSLVLLTALPADAEVQRFGPFSIDNSRPNVISLSGDIDAGSALNFRRALAATPDAELLVLNSPGGLVAMGLLIADDVYQRKMATMIPAGSGCYSSCALIFLAGDERQVDGELGVHQITSEAVSKPCQDQPPWFTRDAQTRGNRVSCHCGATIRGAFEPAAVSFETDTQTIGTS